MAAAPAGWRTSSSARRFDELGVKPALIAGTSIGSIIGAGYAAGFSGKEMRDGAVEFYAKRREVLARLWRVRPMGITDLLRGRSVTPQFDARLILESFVPGLRASAGDVRGTGHPAEGLGHRFLRMDGGGPVARAAAPGDRRLDRHSGALPARWRWTAAC